MLLEVARDALEQSVEYDTPATDISIFESEDAMLVDDGSFLVRGRFPEEGEEDSNRFSDPEGEVAIPKSSSVGKEIESVFNQVRENISVSPAEITSIQFSSCHPPRGDSEYPFYTLEEADSRFFIGVTDVSPPEELLSEALNVAVDAFSEMDESVTRSQIVDMEFLFADRAVCELSSVRGHIETAYPHRHFQIDSFDEYVSKKAETEGLSESELRSKGLHQINSALPVGDNHKPPESVCDSIESLMWSYILDSLETKYGYMIEGEAIQVRGGNYTASDDMLKYYLYVPVVDEEIGTTRFEF